MSQMSMKSVFSMEGTLEINSYILSEISANLNVWEEILKNSMENVYY